MSPPALTRPERLDLRAMDRAWRRLATAPDAPWLHAEVGRRMSERLGIVRQMPTQVLDWWGELGASAPLLARAYPAARIVRVSRPCAPSGLADAETAPRVAPAWRRWLARTGAPARPGPVEQAAVAAGQAGLVWCNMGLHWATAVPALMRAWQQALAVDGFLMFSTLGPGTLQALGAMYARQGWGTAYPPWIDMHDLGDMLVEAGFADPVMDQETLALTWSTPQAALADLRALGSNFDVARHAGLRTPAWLARVHETLRAGTDAQGRVQLDVEVVYGHAFKPQPRARLAPETAVGLDDMRSMLHAGRPGRSR